MHSDNYEEQDLVQAAQQGDREAFALLYERHVERVYRYLVVRLSQPADAEDVTADVFIRALNGLPSYRPRGVPFIAWLYRIAHNEAVNFLKKKSRRRESQLEESAATSGDPAELVVERIGYGEVVRAMDGLTELQHQVISLRFAGQLSIAETAAAMQRNEGAVKALQFSALRALRRVLSRQEATSDV